MSDNIEIKGGMITVNSLRGTNIMGTLYVNDKNINTIIDNAPPNLDEIREIAANLIDVPIIYFNKITEDKQNVTGNVKFNNVAESNSVASGAVVLQGGIGIAKNMYLGGNLNALNNTSIDGNLVVNGGGITSINATSPVNLFNTTTGNIVFGGGNIEMSAMGSNTIIKGGLKVIENVEIASNLTVIGNIQTSSSIIIGDNRLLLFSSNTNGNTRDYRSKSGIGSLPPRPNKPRNVIGDRLVKELVYLPTVDDIVDDSNFVFDNSNLIFDNSNLDYNSTNTIIRGNIEIIKLMGWNDDESAFMMCSANIDITTNDVFDIINIETLIAELNGNVNGSFLAI